ncbi:MAG: hypothetical protein LUD84_02660, partial [Clostridiales bacterium]|nr:hypothetical protein [Clostridiales bacterium]
EKWPAHYGTFAQKRLKEFSEKSETKIKSNSPLTMVQNNYILRDRNRERLVILPPEMERPT